MKDTTGLKTVLVALFVLIAAASASAQLPGRGFFTVPPCRALDTRTDPSGALTHGVQRTVQLTGRCGIPGDAVAVSLNVTAINWGAGGHLEVYAGDQPRDGTGAVNVATGQVRANNRLTRLAGNGTGTINLFPVTTSPGTQVHVTIDVNGYFAANTSTPTAPATGPHFYHPVPPCRAADTRVEGGAIPNASIRNFDLQGQCGVPAGSAAAALNVTAVTPSGTGHLSVFSADAYPSGPYSTINFWPVPATTANGTIAPLGSAPSDLGVHFVSPDAGSATHAVIDVSGYFHYDFAGASAYQPLTGACRIVDTRFAEGPALQSNVPRTIDVLGLLGQKCGFLQNTALRYDAVAVNFTIVGPTNAGHLQAFAAGGPAPLTSVLNFGAGEPAQGNGAIVELGGSGITLNPLVLNQGTVHVIVDVLGIFTGHRDDGQSSTEPPVSQEHPSVARGFDAKTSFSAGDLDTVNLLNGNLTTAIPLGNAYPVSTGFNYAFKLVYNSKIWDFDERWYQAQRYAEAVPNRLSNAGLSWSVHLGRLLDPNDLENTHGTPGGQDAEWVYIDASGAEHVFYPFLNRYAKSGSAVVEWPETAGVSYTRDGSYLRMRVVVQGGITYRDVEFPDGSVSRFERDANDRWWLKRMFNRHVDGAGRPVNYVDIDYSVRNEWRITDSHGRQHFIRFERDPSAAWPTRIRSVDLAAFNGARAVYTFSYADDDGSDGLDGVVTITRTCGQTWPFNDAQVKVSSLAKVTLPDGSAFEPRIYRHHAGNCHAHGMLEQLWLPAGGRLEWDYGTYVFPAAGCSPREWFRISAGVVRRTLHDGATAATWTYTPDLSDPPPLSPILCDDNQFAQPPPEELSNTVVTPLKDKSVHYFSVFPGDVSGTYSGPFRPQENGLAFTRRAVANTPNPVDGMFLSSETFDCDAAGGNCVSRQRKYVRYESDAPRPAAMEGGCSGGLHAEDENCRNLQWRVAADRTVWVEAAGATRHATTASANFDGLGHYRTVTTSGDFPGENTRVVETNFNPSRGRYELVNESPSSSFSFTAFPVSAPWLLQTFDSRKRTEGIDGDFSRFCFNASTGFLERQRIYKSGASNAPTVNDVVIAYAHDGAGNVADEVYHGGDEVPLASLGACDAPANPFQGAQYFIRRTFLYGTLATLGYKGPAGENLAGSLDYDAVDRTIDPSTGLVESEVDPSGIRTAYEYDRQGRPTWIKPQSANPQLSGMGDAWTEYLYLPPAATASARCGAGSEVTGNATICIRRRDHGSKTAAVLAEEQLVFDRLGRVWKERRKLPDGTWNSRATLYNGMGWTSSVSELGAATATQYLEYDVFGRPGRIRPPDGPGDGARDVHLSYAGVRSVSRTVRMGVASDSSGRTVQESVTRTHVFDRFGRLLFVREPSTDPCARNGNLETEYSYDHADRLTDVRWNLASGCPAQNRDFDFDARGFLKGERHPEKDRNILTDPDRTNDVDYLQYDARGHAKRVVDGQHDLTYVYDRAERLVSIRDRASGKVLKAFTYGTGEAAGDRSRGKVTRAERNNYYNGLADAANINVVETYAYGGRGGRRSYRATDVAGSLVESFSQSFAYDPFGRVSQLDYPDCRSLACRGTAPPRTVTFTFQRGFLTAVPGWANDITYHANELVARVRMANGVDWRQDIAGDGMARPSFICAPAAAETRPCAQLGGLGPYSYDAAGNVIAVGGENYRYDTLGRTVQGSMSSPHSETYQYDPYGNLTSISLVMDGQNTITFMQVDPNTNRLTSAQAMYDRAGNLLGRGGVSFTYDSFNQRSTMTGSTNNLAYAYTADDERLLIWDRAANRRTWRLRDLDRNVLREYVNNPDGSWSWGRDYVYRGTSLLATEIPGAGTRYFQVDHLRSPRSIRNASGGGVFAHHYLPFGTDIVTSSDPEVLRFTGHERDFGAAAGRGDDFDYMHARYYDLQYYRFLSPDPAWSSADLDTPQSWNRYAYAMNNPVNRTDPTGRVADFALEGQALEWWVTKLLMEQAGADKVESQVQFVDEHGNVRIIDNTVKLDEALQGVEVKGENNKTPRQAGMDADAERRGAVDIRSRNKPKAGPKGSTQRYSGTTQVAHSTQAKSVVMAKFFGRANAFADLVGFASAQIRFRDWARRMEAKYGGDWSTFGDFVNWYVSGQPEEAVCSNCA